MGDKKKKEAKKAATSKEEKRTRAAARQNVISSFSKGEKRVLNPKREKAKKRNGGKAN